MDFEIDQSGKVEDTNKLTVVAFANGKVKSLKISAVEKQKLVQAMKALDNPEKSFVFKIFSGLIFLLIKDEKTEKIIIDKEYFGNEGIIKNIIIQLFHKARIKEPQEITFASIGKNSKAHQLAIEVFRKRKMPDMIVKSQDILNLFY